MITCNERDIHHDAACYWHDKFRAMEAARDRALALVSSLVSILDDAKSDAESIADGFGLPRDRAYRIVQNIEAALAREGIRPQNDGINTGPGARLEAEEI